MSTSAVSEMVADAQELLDGETADLTLLLVDLAALGNTKAPAPSAELALLLAGRATPARSSRPARPTVRARQALAGLAVAAVSGLSMTGSAAVANELPVPMQRVVAHFSEQFLPFDLPRPAGDPPAHRDDATPGAHRRSHQGTVSTTTQGTSSASRVGAQPSQPAGVTRATGGGTASTTTPPVVRAGDGSARPGTSDRLPSSAGPVGPSEPSGVATGVPGVGIGIVPGVGPGTGGVGVGTGTGGIGTGPDTGSDGTGPVGQPADGATSQPAEPSVPPVPGAASPGADTTSGAGDVGTSVGGTTADPGADPGAGPTDVPVDPGAMPGSPTSSGAADGTVTGDGSGSAATYEASPGPQ